MNEEILVSRYTSGDGLLVIEAIVRLTGPKELSQEILYAHGLGRIYPIGNGQVIEIPQLIHYHLENGRFSKASAHWHFRQSRNMYPDSAHGARVRAAIPAVHWVRMPVANSRDDGSPPPDQVRRIPATG